MKHAVAAIVLAMVMLSGCSTKSAKELFDQAAQAQREAQNAVDSLGKAANVPDLYEPVIDKYEKVFDKYPKSAEAEQALFKVGEIQAGIVNQPENAIRTFQKYADAFPSTPRAETAMFMVGYIYNNNLNMIDSARAAYTRFLQKFPDAELTTSAQYELNTLGKNPEELLPSEPGEELHGAEKKGH